MHHYFSPDGNWGGADGLLIVDTSRWTAEMFNAMDSELDRLKTTLARHFSEGIHGFEIITNEFTGKQDTFCPECELSIENLGMAND